MRSGSPAWAPRARRLLAAAGALEADPLVLVPQRVTQSKRLELAIDAAAQLARRLPRLRMLVTGPVDPHSADSRAYAIQLPRRRTALGLGGTVRFVLEEATEDGQHPVHDEDVAELYRVSDALLITSASEGFGLPLLEAALARVPIVCTDLHGWPVHLASDEQDPLKLNRDRPEVSAFESVGP